MRLVRSMTATALSVSSLLLLVTPARAAGDNLPLCTREQEQKFSGSLINLPLNDCEVFLDSDFACCTDECLAMFQDVVATSPACRIVGETTLKGTNTANLQKCEGIRANTTAYKYIPIATPGMVNCTQTELDAWDATYGRNTSMGACTDSVSLDQGCSKDCVKTIEDCIEASPQCIMYSQTYGFREFVKKTLVGCLTQRGDDIKSNKVLHSTANGKAGKTKSDTSATSAGSGPGPIAFSSSVAMALLGGVALTLL